VVGPVFASRGFWLAFAAVVFVHAVNGLHEYFPRHVPELATTFDLRPVLTERPWSHLEERAETATV